MNLFKRQNSNPQIFFVTFVKVERALFQAAGAIV